MQQRCRNGQESQADPNGQAAQAQGCEVWEGEWIAQEEPEREDERDFRKISFGEAIDYLEQMGEYGRQIGKGVMLCIFCSRRFDWNDGSFHVSHYSCRIF